MDKKYPEIKLDRNLQKLIRGRAMTVKGLARKTDVKQATLHGYIYGNKPRNLHALVRLAQFFGISLDELILSHSNKSENSQDSLKFEITIISKEELP